MQRKTHTFPLSKYSNHILPQNLGQTCNGVIFWMLCENRRICNHTGRADHQKRKRVPKKHLLLLCWLRQSLELCGSQKTVENSERDGNTRPSDLPLERSVCRSGSTRTGHGTDWFQIEEGLCQGCIVSPCLFNFDAEDIMRNAGLEEAQAGIKISGEIPITSDMQMTPPLWQKVKRN